MPQVYTIETAIRKNRLEYRRLMAFVARLNLELFLMKQRMKKITTDEQKWTGLKIILSMELEQLEQRKTNLEQQPISKALSVKGKQKQLDKIEKQLIELNAQYTRNEHHLAVLEKRKYKDNPVKLVLKEAKRNDVQLQADAAKKAWDTCEQILKYEQADFEAFVAQQNVAKTTLVEKILKSSLFPHPPLLPRQIAVGSTRMLHSEVGSLSRVTRENRTNLKKNLTVVSALSKDTVSVYLGGRHVTLTFEDR